MELVLLDLQLDVPSHMLGTLYYSFALVEPADDVIPVQGLAGQSRLLDLSDPLASDGPF